MHNKVIGEGYNGPPQGFWHAQSPCTEWCQRTKNVEFTANSKSGVLDLKSEIARLGLHPTYDDCPSLHAEANALMMSDRTLRWSGTIYVTSHVCVGCAKLIANSGLLTLYVVADEDSVHRNSEASYTFLANCGFNVFVNGVNLGRKVGQS